MTLRLPLLLLLFHHACPFMGASDQASPFPPERRVIFTCLSWDDEVDFLYYQTLIRDPKAPVSFAANKPAPLTVSTGGTKIASSFRSEPQSYLGPAVINFFTAPPEAGPTSAAQSRKPVASVFLPPDQHRLLLLFFRQPFTPDLPGPQYRIEMLPDGADDLPMGGYLLVNSTGKKLTGSMGKQSFELEARSKKTLTSPGNATQRLEWRLWTASRKEKPLYSSLWQHRPDARTLIFITTSEEQRGALAVKAIQDIGEPASPREEPPPLPK